jgi:hypothetical protein
LEQCYQHALGFDGQHFTAYNMVVGAFGGVLDRYTDRLRVRSELSLFDNRDLLCIQSLDGKLQLFDQDTQAFSRQLTGCCMHALLR